MVRELKGFYINLDKNQRRRQAVETQLSLFGLADAFSRFPAVDGARLSREPGGMTAGVRGCFESHAAVLRQARPLACAIHVVEDDVLFSEHTRPVLQNLLDAHAFDKWDIIFTSMLVPLEFKIIKEYRKMLGESATRQTRSGRFNKQLRLLDATERYFACTDSYVVPAASVPKLSGLLDGALARGPSCPVDLYLRDQIRRGRIRAACVFPFITSINLPLTLASMIRNPDHDLPALAHDLLRYSFFLGWDANISQQALRRLQSNTAFQGQDAAIGSVLAFGLSEAYRSF